MIPGGDVLTVGVLLAAFGACALAVQSLAIRYGTITSSSAEALVVVLAVNVLVLVPAAFLFGSPAETLTRDAVAAFAAAGLVGTMVGRAFHYEGIKRIGSSRAEPIKASQPLHASLVAVVVLGEVVTTGHLVSMVAIVAGIAVITYEHGRTDGGSGAGYVGLAFPLAAAFFFGIEPTLAKIGFGEGTAALTGLAVKTVSAGAAFLAYLWWTRGLPDLRTVDRRELPWLVAAGVANTLFLVGYYGALELEPVSLVVPLVQSSPLVVILLSVLFVSDDLELVTWRLAAGALVAVAGAVGVTLFG
ncbi:EamA family transporter [Halobacterium sp. CBA1126]|uniref:DMT family transporter n=1 Tax=Halobacterium sp. CBA1126 TaxID=2668074 RepID=UPI0012F89D0A|nr:EamA family transporter [Halobacterium sp. CBA1126]MUV59910.1 EamA family transporter [Halobacterium sp. CBA1126]